jgi:hypothetical protein
MVSGKFLLHHQAVCMWQSKLAKRLSSFYADLAAIAMLYTNPQRYLGTMN